jgi:cephalosporin-C deacetylase-like acetyl esterase
MHGGFMKKHCSVFFAGLFCACTSSQVSTPPKDYGSEAIVFDAFDEITGDFDAGDVVGLLDEVDSFAEGFTSEDPADCDSFGDFVEEVESLENLADFETDANGLDTTDTVSSQDFLDEYTSVLEPPLFDMDLIRDPSMARCEFTDERTTIAGGRLLQVWRVTFMSLESVGGELREIRIRGFSARPLGSGQVPGIVVVHGLGGYAEESHATGTASLLGVFAIAYTGPGGGKPDDPETQSEGEPAMDPQTGSFYRLFDTVPDPRGSWIWAHAVAGMRALTCLETRSDVDKGKLGITGGSAGAMVSLIASGVDDRIKASVPVSGCGAFDIAVKSPLAWQHYLLTASGLTTESIEFQRFLEYLDPIVYARKSKANIFMVNGSCDEFFPLTAHVATFDAIPDNVEKRTAIIANFDHGCYQVSAIEPKDKVEERAQSYIGGATVAWFSCFFGLSDDFRHIPDAPQVMVNGDGGTIQVLTAPSNPDNAFDIEHVSFWLSNDDAFTFVSMELQALGGGAFGGIAPVPLQSNTVYYVDVNYKTKSLFFPVRFTISSRPEVPENFVPHIRAIGSCL